MQFLFYLNPKFQASSSFLCLYRPVCVRPVRKPHCWFSHETAHIIRLCMKRLKYSFTVYIECLAKLLFSDFRLSLRFTRSLALSLSLSLIFFFFFAKTRLFDCLFFTFYFILYLELNRHNTVFYNVVSL